MDQTVAKAWLMEVKNERRICINVETEEVIFEACAESSREYKGCADNTMVVGSDLRWWRVSSKFTMWVKRMGKQVLVGPLLSGDWRGNL